MILILAWLVCGVVAYGLVLGTFTARWPEYYHGWFALTLGLFGGPISIVCVLFESPRVFRFRPLTKEERWASYKKKYPFSSREQFEKGIWAL